MEEAVIKTLAEALAPYIRQIADEVVSQRVFADEGLKVSEVQKVLQMSEGRVRELIATGKLRSIRPTPRTIRVPRSAINDYLQGC